MKGAVFAKAQSSIYVSKSKLVNCSREMHSVISKEKELLKKIVSGEKCNISK